MQRRPRTLTLLLLSALIMLIGLLLLASTLIGRATQSASPIVTSISLLRSATPAPTATAKPLQPGPGTETAVPTQEPIPVMTHDDQGSEPILPTETPTFTPTPDLLGTLIVQATGTASVFDARATVDAASAQTVTPLAGIAQPFAVRDHAGAILGSGEIRLYAPPRLALDEAGTVRVEIVVNGTIPGIALTLNPPYTATPALGPTRPTPTPLALADRQFVTVREYMGAALGGADAGRFLIDPVPPDGIRRLQANAVNWWKWNLRAAGESSVGVNRLEIRVFLPQTLGDGTDISAETNLIPFEIEVVKPSPVSLDALAQGFLGIAGLLATLGGATGFLLTAYRLTAKRFQQPPPSPPEPPKTT